MAIAILIGCSTRPALPSWSDPLVRSPRDALPARPEVTPIEPPTFAVPRELPVPDGAPSLALLPSQESFATIAVSTRRGNDGGWDDGLLPFTMALLEYDLRRTLGEAAVASTVDLYGATLLVLIPREDLQRGMIALYRTLTGTISPSLVARAKADAGTRVERWRDQPSISTTLSAIDRLHGFRRGIYASVQERVERLHRIDLQRVRACRAERFAPSDVLVLVQGDVSTESVGAAFEQTFGEMRGELPRRPPRAFPEVVPDVAAISEPSTAPQAYATFLRRAPRGDHHDRLAFEMLMEILGGSLSSRLNGSLRETHAYTYGAFAQILHGEYSDVLRVHAAFRSEEVADAVQGLFDHMRQLRTDPITSTELALARARVWVGAERRSDVTTVIRAWHLGLSVAEWERRHHVLANITPAQLQSVARRHFDPHGGVFVLTGDFSAIAGVWVQRNGTGFHLRRD